MAIKNVTYTRRLDVEDPKGAAIFTPASDDKETTETDDVKQIEVTMEAHWTEPDDLKDDDGNTFNTLLANQLQATNVHETVLLSWLQEVDGRGGDFNMEMLQFNLLENKVQNGPTDPNSGTFYNSLSSFYYYWKGHGSSMRAYAVDQQGNCSMEEYEPHAGWNSWENTSVTLPSELGNVIQVLRIQGATYLIGVNKTDNTVNLGVVSPFREGIDVLGALPITAFNPGDNQVSVIAYSTAAGENCILATYADTSNGNKITSGVVNINDLSTLLYKQVVSQTSTAPPSMTYDDDGNIFAVYTGEDQYLYSLTYDIENNNWFQSVQLMDNIEVHRDFNPAVVNTAKGLYVFYVDKLHYMSYIVGTRTYTVNPV